MPLIAIVTKIDELTEALIDKLIEINEFADFTETAGERLEHDYNLAGI